MDFQIINATLECEVHLSDLALRAARYLYDRPDQPNALMEYKVGDCDVQMFASRMRSGKIKVRQVKP